MSFTTGTRSVTVSWVPFRTLMIPLTNTQADVHLDRDNVLNTENAYSVGVDFNVFSRWDVGTDGTVATLQVILEGANEHRDGAFQEIAAATFNVMSALTSSYVVSKTITNDGAKLLRMKFNGVTATASSVTAMIGYEVRATVFSRT